MNFLRVIQNWRRWIGFVVIVTYLVLLVIALPLCIWELERKGAPDHVEAWFIGGLFVMLALPISFWGILHHVINYTCPHLQRHIIRILWMVPIYGMNAWFALRFPPAAIYLDTLRECYEAYVIYNFMAYLMSFLHHDYPHLDIQLENKPPVKHIFPLCLLPPCQNGIHFLRRCKHGVLQYTIVRPAMTLIALICEMNGKYDEGDFNFTSGWSYIVIINNISQVTAMYCLVLFYRAFKEELKPIKPVPKFLCVKAVVFLSFWQIVVIATLVKLNLIPQNGTWVFYKSVKEVATGLQDFLICIEMFIAAIAHYYSFSHKPFINMAAQQQDCCSSFLSMLNVSDVTDDVVEHARYISHGMKKTFIRGRNGEGEFSPLLGNSEEERETSTENTYFKKPLTPGEEDASSISDSLTGRNYDSFVNRSQTSSMNNFAEFSVSVDVNEAKRKASSVSLLAYQQSDDENLKNTTDQSYASRNSSYSGLAELEKSNRSEDAGHTEFEKLETSDILDIIHGNGAQSKDEDFEHLDKDDDGIHKGNELDTTDNVEKDGMLNMESNTTLHSTFENQDGDDDQNA